MDKILKASCELLLAVHDDMNYVNLEHYVTTKKNWKVVLYHTKSLCYNQLVEPQ